MLLKNNKYFLRFFLEKTENTLEQFPKRLTISSQGRFPIQTLYRVQRQSLWLLFLVLCSLLLLMENGTRQSNFVKLRNRLESQWLPRVLPGRAKIKKIKKFGKSLVKLLGSSCWSMKILDLFGNPFPNKKLFLIRFFDNLV